jgi:eukaryotic-like serine/threonine-protein kinase
MSGVTSQLQAAVAGRYLVVRELGAGAAATVYLAQDLRHHRNVAIKVLHPELAASLGADRFLREIEIAASLRHPHILPLFDSGDSNGLLYYVMPYVEGETLRQRLDRDGAIPVYEALRLAREVADALTHAHAHGVVHRDIKPDNIMIEAGHAVLSDFGIAKALESAGRLSPLTGAGMSLGTPSYMSPEQAQGDPSLDGRSDVYSLACVLYEMLVGSPPFTGPSAEMVVRQQIAAPPPQITLSRTVVPERVKETLRRAMAKTPDDRFASAAEFAASLRASQGSMSVRMPFAHRIVRRHPSALIITVVVAITALLLAMMLR